MAAADKSFPDWNPRRGPIQEDGEGRHRGRGAMVVERWDTIGAGLATVGQSWRMITMRPRVSPGAVMPMIGNVVACGSKRRSNMCSRLLRNRDGEHDRSRPDQARGRHGWLRWCARIRNEGVPCGGERRRSSDCNLWPDFRRPRRSNISDPSPNDDVGGP